MVVAALTNPAFQGVSPYLVDEKEHRRSMATAINSMVQGKFNVAVPITLTANSTTTTIRDARIGYYSVITPAMATTAHGAAAIAAGIYVDTILPALGSTSASAIIHHASSANTDQNITFMIIG